MDRQNGRDRRPRESGGLGTSRCPPPSGNRTDDGATRRPDSNRWDISRQDCATCQGNCLARCMPSAFIQLLGLNKTAILKHKEVVAVPTREAYSVLLTGAIANCTFLSKRQISNGGCRPANGPRTELQRQERAEQAHAGTRRHLTVGKTPDHILQPGGKEGRGEEG